MRLDFHVQEHGMSSVSSDQFLCHSRVFYKFPHIGFECNLVDFTPRYFFYLYFFKFAFLCGLSSFIMSSHWILFVK